jgi:hypothetical protein
MTEFVCACVLCVFVSVCVDYHHQASIEAGIIFGLKATGKSIDIYRTHMTCQDQVW